MRYLKILVAIVTAAGVTWGAFADVACAASSAEQAANSKEAANETRGSGAADRTDPETSAVKELGITEGKEINAGFAFFDGRYLDGPYTVSRRGVRILINEEPVYEWTRWPLPNLRVDEDPGVPEGLNAASTFEDLRRGGLNSHMARKQRYLYQHYSGDVAKKKMLEYYRQLPCVESAVPERPDSLRTLVIRMKNGKEVLINVTPPHPDSLFHWDFGDEALVRRLNVMRQRYETRLMKGDCFFLFSSGEELSWGRRQTARDLGLMVEILRSDRPKKDKVSLLQRMEVLPPPSRGDIDKFTALVTGFQAPPELDKRIRKLVTETGVTPRRLEHIPNEIPFERILRLEKEAKKRANQPQK